jgi:hypothetical protein
MALFAFLAILVHALAPAVCLSSLLLPPGLFGKCTWLYLFHTMNYHAAHARHHSAYCATEQQHGAVLLLLC